jgi:DNA replication and repair protein RecF
VLEAVYCLANASFALGRSIDEAISASAAVASVTGVVARDDEAYGETYSVSLDRETRKAKLSREKSAASRPDYLSRLPFRAVLFHPAEMNILSLSPSLRRDFLDEILSVAHPEFARTRREYTQALASRNKLLKALRERPGATGELDLWDRLFAERAGEYLDCRFRLMRELSAFVPAIERVLHGKYAIELRYESRAEESDATGSVLAYCRANRERDIIVGHTSVGPHTDDLFVFVRDAAGTMRRASEYLSRGETKSLLLGLKAFQVSYIRSRVDKEIILLFDDLFSELDQTHIDLVLSLFPHEQAIFTSQSDRHEELASISGASVVSIA